MKEFRLFLELIRINKPIGILLLFWPCSWGLTLANDFDNKDYQYLTYLVYFFFWLGANEVCWLHSK